MDLYLFLDPKKSTCILCNNNANAYDTTCTRCDKLITYLIKNISDNDSKIFVSTLIADFIIQLDCKNPLINHSRILADINTDVLGNVVYNEFEIYMREFKEYRAKMKHRRITLTSTTRKCIHSKCRHGAILPVPNIYKLGTPIFEEMPDVKMRKEYHQHSNRLCLKHVRLSFMQTIRQPLSFGYKTIMVRLLQLSLMHEYNTQSEQRIKHPIHISANALRELIPTQIDSNYKLRWY